MPARPRKPGSVPRFRLRVDQRNGSELLAFVEVEHQAVVVAAAVALFGLRVEAGAERENPLPRASGLESAARIDLLAERLGIGAA
jgi:hypothetical protein